MKIPWVMPLKMCSIIVLHCLVKIHSILIIYFCLGIYFSSYRYYHVHGHDIFWNSSNWSILLFICWQYLSQVVFGALPCLYSLCVFFRNWILYFRILPRYGFLHWCFLGIIFLHWYCWMFLWFWVIITRSSTLIWCRNECRWWIMLLIIHEHQFISFFKTTHGLPVSGWNKIFATTVDSGEVRIKCNMELWWYTYCQQAKYQCYFPWMDWRYS